jgi:hypothetical protein
MSIDPLSVTCVEVVKVARSGRAVVAGFNRGGGTDFQGDVYLSPVSAETTPDTQLQVWVKNLDGSEERLDFHNIDVPVHDGDKLALLSTSIKVLGIKNFTSGTMKSFVRAKELATPQASSSPKFVKICFIFGVVLLVVILVGWGTGLASVLLNGPAEPWTLLCVLILLSVFGIILHYRLNRERLDSFNDDEPVREGRKFASFNFINGKIKMADTNASDKSSSRDTVKFCFICGAVLFAVIYVLKQVFAPPIPHAPSTGLGIVWALLCGFAAVVTLSAVGHYVLVRSAERDSLRAAQQAAPKSQIFEGLVALGKAEFHGSRPDASES